MANTDFAVLQPQEKVVWVKETLKAMRDDNFFGKFTGTGDKSIVQEVRELSVNNKGATTAQISLVHDLKGTGVGGDATLLGNEEAMDSSYISITYDQLRHAVMNTGKLNDQKSVLSFREFAKERLGQWASNVIEEFLFLTATGVSYDLNLDGSARTVLAGQSAWSTLDFAPDLSASTSARHFNWNGTALVAGDTTTVTAGYVPTYKMLLQLKATAMVRGLKPLKLSGSPMFVLVMEPRAFALLKADPDFRTNFTQGAPRDLNSKIFTGMDGITTDGIIIHTSNKVFNTSGAANGSKWGAGGLVDGCANLLLGAQALAMVNIHSGFEWNEEWIDYKNKGGISVGMMIGFRKPKFKSAKDGNTVQDFGIMRVNTAI